MRTISWDVLDQHSNDQAFNARSATIDSTQYFAETQIPQAQQIIPAENIMEVLKESLTKKISPIDWKEEDIVTKSSVKTNDENLIAH